MKRERAVKRLTRNRQRLIAVGLFVLSVSVFLWAAELPMVATFEDLSEAPLAAQTGWHAAPEDAVLVSGFEAYGGQRCVLIPTNSMLRLNFADSTATNVWIDFYLRRESRSVGAEPILSREAVAGFFIDENGCVVVRSNSSWVVCSGFMLATGRWARFTVNLDYGARRWALYAAGDTPNELSIPLGRDLSFNSGATNTYFRSFRIKN